MLYKLVVYLWFTFVKWCYRRCSVLY